jgi:hypothetical protein
MLTKKSRVLHWAWRRISFSTDACHWSRIWERFCDINKVADMAQSESWLVYAIDNRVFVVYFATAVVGSSPQKRPGRLWSPLTLGAVLPDVKRLVREANYSPVFTTKVKNYWIYTSTCSNVFITFILFYLLLPRTNTDLFPSDSPTKFCRQYCICHLRYTMIP